MHLWCRFYVGRPLFDEAQLDALQTVINELLPAWASKLRVARSETSRNVLTVRRTDRLFDAIHEAAPPKRGLGSAVLTGSYKSLSFFLDHCDGTLPPELNYMAVEVYELSVVEGKTTSAWARQFLETLCSRLGTRYGNARVREEYAKKNMVDDETGVRAIGPNPEVGLRGLYWLNFFGAPYVELMGRERLLTAPAYEVKAVDDGVLIALDAAADAWQSDAYKKREQGVIEHLGKQYFFCRTDPDRELVAPDFRAYRDRPNDG